jgi:hypothetical protein
MGNKIASVLGVVVALLVAVFAVSGTAKGFLFTLFWDQKSPLTCGGSFAMTVKGKQIKMDKGPIFDVGGNCELHVIDCDLVAPSVLSGGGSAHVVLEGGSITASGTAISVGGSALVEIKGTKVSGQVSKGGTARVTGLPELDRQQAAEDAQKALDDKWGRQACEGLIECYKKAAFVGQAAARVVGELDAGGQVARVQVTGQPGEQRACLESTMKAKHVEAFDGGRGKLVCEFSGMFAAGSQMLTVGGGFRR